MRKDEHCCSWETLYAQIFRIYHVRGVTYLVLDDDKWRKRSDDFRRYGLKVTAAKASGLCPVMHIVVSLTTGVPLAGRIDRPGNVSYCLIDRHCAS